MPGNRLPYILVYAQKGKIPANFRKKSKKVYFAGEFHSFAIEGSLWASAVFCKAFIAQVVEICAADEIIALIAEFRVAGAEFAVTAGD